MCIHSTVHVRFLWRVTASTDAIGMILFYFIFLRSYKANV
uniref:Uncharacterized protein n=1 Tax=Anguilla anguilla TaxID=7936 RepID=A0A0E9S7R7_ANGAN